MLTAIPTTKEQLIYYMLNHISLGTYDKKFFDNIINLHIATNKPVTTNQAELLNNIVIRYQRQLAKCKLNAHQLVNLYWTLQPIESITKFTQVRIEYVDDNLIMTSPYKKQFVKKLHKLDYGKWDKTNKQWVYPFSEFILKELFKCVHEYFDKINFSDNLAMMLEELQEFDNARYWNPTLVRRHNNLYIFATNPSIDKLLPTLEFTTSLPALARFVKSGITIDKQLLNELYDELGSDAEAINKLAFATDRNCTFELNDVEKLAKYIILLDSDFVVITPTYGLHKDYTDRIKTELEKNNICCHIRSLRSDFDVTSLKNYKFPILINAGIVSDVTCNYMASKVINIVNSNLVQI